MTDQLCQCGQPTTGAWLCDKCAHTFRWSLVNVAAHYHDLGNVEAKQVRYSTSGATKGSIGKTQPLPVDMRFTGTLEHGTQLKYDTWATITAWARTIMETHPAVLGPACTDCLHVTCSTVRRSRWPTNTVTSMVAYLARQFRHILSQQWAPDMFDEFLDLERRLTHMVNRPPDRWYAGHCGYTDEYGTCDAELYAIAEHGTISCPSCGILHNVAERRDKLLTEAKDHQVTATEAAAALMSWTDYDGTTKKLIDLIAYWRENKALDDRGVTEVNGQWRTVYRLGDVQDRLIEHAQREQARRIKPQKAS